MALSSKGPTHSVRWTLTLLQNEATRFWKFNLDNMEIRRRKQGGANASVGVSDPRDYILDPVPSADEIASEARDPVYGELTHVSGDQRADGVVDSVEAAVGVVDSHRS